MALLLTGREFFEERFFNDQIADAALKQLAARGLLQYSHFDVEAFAKIYMEVTQKFVVPESSITTRMARLLYGITDAVQPRSVLVIGSYVANSLIWLAAPVLTSAYIVGVDIDQEANDTAKQNLASIVTPQVEIYTMDGHEAGKLFSSGIDLLLLDADSATLGKRIYVSLLTTLEPYLNPEALILAHDICYEKFSQDVEPYLLLVRNQERFQQTVTLAIDQFGLEVTKR